MAGGFTEFEFDLPEALLVSLVNIFREMESAPLNIANLSAIPDAQGVYQLFLDGQLSYIGKTDAEAGLRKRLIRHSEKIKHRIGLDPARVTFRAVRVFVFTAIDLETQLIRHYGVKTWNGSGFGSNDPGRERDTTKYKVDHFDSLFPIDIDWPISSVSLPDNAPASEYFRLLRGFLPYTFRFETVSSGGRKPHLDLLNIVTVDPKTVRSVRLLIEAIVSQLPSGWQAVKLPSHLILYKETKAYPSGEVLARS